MTRLRQRLLEELQRRNYAPDTTRGYILAVKQFAEYFGKSPDRLGPEQVRRFQLHLLNEKRLSAGTVKNRMSALRFFYRKALKRRDLTFDDLPFPRIPVKLPTVLSREEVTQLIDAAANLINAIFPPSGDQRGFETFTGGDVSWNRWLPSTLLLMRLSSGRET